MDTYNHNTETYINRMNQTALSKFECVKPYLASGKTMLDFGSGFSPEFIDEVKSTGATYVACDASPVVQEKLHALGITTVTQEELPTERFDVIFLSSVFHELISYLSDVEYYTTLDALVRALKPGGYLVIRDWANPGGIDECHIIIQSGKLAEVELWTNALCYNEIIERPTFQENILTASERDMYQIIFHTVWGVDSIAREARETYDVTPRVHDFGTTYGLKLVHHNEEYDQTYLPHTQNYFDVSDVPFATKGIWIFQKQ